MIYEDTLLEKLDDWWSVAAGNPKHIAGGGTDLVAGLWLERTEGVGTEDLLHILITTPRDELAKKLGWEKLLAMSPAWTRRQALTRIRIACKGSGAYRGDRPPPHTKRT